MNKKSALVTAGGLTASFVAGIAAVSFDWGLMGTNAATAATPASASSKAQKPIVRHRTIVVHKKPKPTKAPGVGARTVTVPAPSTTVASTPPSHPVTSTGGSPTTGHDDDGGEHEGGGD